MKMNIIYFKKVLLIIILVASNNSFADEFIVKNNSANKTILFGNDKIKIVLDYNLKCIVSNIEIYNLPVVSTLAGVNSQIRIAEKSYSTLILNESPIVKIKKNMIEVIGIKYGDDEVIINEKWKFVITETEIKFEIERELPNSIIAEEASFPSFNFDNVNTWEGAFLGNGGVAWFYLFNEKLCTYGVHTNYSAFWDSKTDNGLKITVASPGKHIAMKYSSGNNDELVYNISVYDEELIPRYDVDTHRRRFIREKTDVWSSFEIPSGKYKQTLTLAPFKYSTEYSRGNLNGIDGKKVTSVLNTIARIGIIDSKLYGGNSWHTPYGPICLHEQYIAQFGIAIDDSNFIKGYKECLDYYRDNAINSEGRVLPRWAYDDSDAMPGTATPLGFYEAQWGYLLDSNPDYVANVSQLYNLSGDVNWVRNQKISCEAALDYLLKRDSNGNNLVEMMTDSHLEKRGSDWIDIIWASFENAFVSAKLYYALILWSDVEKQFGDFEKANYYSNYAAKLKESFNKSTAMGGFWDDQNKWYVHWRDQDSTIHGNNFVVPVNLMAVAYGICESEEQRVTILETLEDQMQKENLFTWPICLYTYEKGEGRDNQFPFPHYENGDIFLSWGAVGVQAYASYKPELALKYIENVLSRYSQDGLAYQRYGRTKQNGLGDDILSGNCLAIAGLYQSIYGINPLYNRLYLNPHLTKKLNGTELNYTFRGNSLKIGLSENHYSVANEQFEIMSSKHFGFYSLGSNLYYFNGNSDSTSLKIQTKSNQKISLEILKWDSKEFSWNQSSENFEGNIECNINGASPNNFYTVRVNSKKLNVIKSNEIGNIIFNTKIVKDVQLIEIKIKS